MQSKSNGPVFVQSHPWQCSLGAAVALQSRETEMLLNRTINDWGQSVRKELHILNGKKIQCTGKNKNRKRNTHEHALMLKWVRIP